MSYFIDCTFIQHFTGIILLMRLPIRNPELSSCYLYSYIVIPPTIILIFFLLFFFSVGLLNISTYFKTVFSFACFSHSWCCSLHPCQFHGLKLIFPPCNNGSLNGQTFIWDKDIHLGQFKQNLL